MNLNYPYTWKCPESFHPGSDGIWEISQLKKLAKEILKQAPELTVELSLEDQTCIFFTVQVQHQSWVKHM